MPGIFTTAELTDLQTTLGPGADDASVQVYRAPTGQVSGGGWSDEYGFGTRTGTVGSNPNTAQVVAATYYGRIHDGAQAAEDLMGHQRSAACPVWIELNANQSPVIHKSDRLVVGSRTFEVKDPGCANTHDVIRMVGCIEVL